MAENTDVRIREATPDDCPVLLELISELAQYEKLAHEVVADIVTLQKHLFGPRPHGFALLAETKGTIAGFCLYFYNFSTFLGKPGLYIEDIFVREPYRNRNIGKGFFDAIIERARKEECGRIEWAVLDWNKPAIDFYRRRGAEPMSEWTVWRLALPPRA